MYVDRQILIQPQFNEQFLTYVPAPNLTTESLSQYILDTLRKHQLDHKCIVSQGYDGASVMSGHCSGVQARIREVAPQAIYIYCNAHCLNLALVDSVKAFRDASEFFALLETLYVFCLQQNVTPFFSNSRKNCILINSNGNYRDYIRHTLGLSEWCSKCLVLHL